jgi:hypothetical protein
MKYYKSLSTVFLILLLLFSMTLTSCSLLLADRETFDGGEILDNEKMSEIRSKVFATEPIETEADESGERNSNASDAGQPKETDKIDEHPTTETEVASLSEKGSEAIETDHLIDMQDVVYWTQNGEVWHTKEDCRYLKNKDVISGSQKDAIDAGKSRLCSSCEK